MPMSSLVIRMTLKCSKVSSNDSCMYMLGIVKLYVYGRYCQYISQKKSLACCYHSHIH